MAFPGTVVIVNSFVKKKIFCLIAVALHYLPKQFKAYTLSVKYLICNILHVLFIIYMLKTCIFFLTVFSNEKISS